jgi:serine phosphatase RsbU (regulator of sigma subunit)/predicted negative regulator of RcsB-dependent stress response
MQCRLCQKFNEAGDYQSARYYGMQGLTAAEKSSDAYGAAVCLIAMATVETAEYQYSKALGYYRKSLRLAQEHDYPQLISQNYQSIGALYMDQGNYPQALWHYQQGLKNEEKSNNPKGIADFLFSIGNIYAEIGQTKQALAFLERSLEMVRQLNLPVDVSKRLNNIGSIYVSEKKFDQALANYQKSLQVMQAAGNQQGIACCLENIAIVYGHRNKYDETLKYQLESIAIKEKIGDKKGLSLSYLNIGTTYLDKKDYNSARNYIEKGFALASETQYLFYMRFGTELLAQLYAQTGDHCQALHYLKLNKKYSDSLNNQAKAKEIGRLEAQFLYDQDLEARRKEQFQADSRRKQWSYILIGGAGVALLLMGFMYLRYRSKSKTNQLLAEKSNLISIQTAELANAYEELNATLNQAQAQKETILQKNIKIEDSIRYAYRIQTTILPDNAYLKALLPKHFIFYQPKDIVSGDFYWVTERENLIFFCVADCTGHGVPGAFMSVVGSNALHHAVNEMGLTEPDTILYEADRKIRSMLHQEKDSESKDGMDVCLCVWDKSRNLLQFAGAGRPLYHLSNGNLSEIKGDKFPIGGGQHENKTFTAHPISLQSGDRLYLFTDGITDQFGGNPKKKFTPKRLQEFILNHQSLTITEQGALFHQTMHDWMRGQAQLDDLTLMAVEV